MTGSAKQSISPLAELWIASSLSLLARTEADTHSTFQTATSRHDFAFSPPAREVCQVNPPKKPEGAGKTGCRLHPWAPCNKKHGGRTTGEPEQRRPSLRNGVTAYRALSPATGLFLPPSPCRMSRRT